MTSDYRGIIIEESLTDADVLKKVEILGTRVSPVTFTHGTPWLKRWTLHSVRIPSDRAASIAEEIREKLDSGHAHSWYADFCNTEFHYIVFPQRIFKIERGNAKQYDEAKQYGLSLGIPPHQVDFHPEVKKWEQ